MSAESKDSNDPFFQGNAISFISDENELNAVEPGSQDLYIILEDDYAEECNSNADGATSILQAINTGITERPCNSRNVGNKGSVSSSMRRLDYYFRPVDTHDVTDDTGIAERTTDVYRIDANTVLDPMSLLTNPQNQFLENCSDPIRQFEQKDKVSVKDVTVAEPKQLKLDFQNSYPTNHPKKLNLRKQLALLYGCTSISANVMQTKEFRHVLKPLIQE
ncbi:unnamed protein product [Allacma fusca]|uniref:Uncharacterized protein n=1 Tax=Allacma fusca TaxID=39272 RepID=A0A8J2PYM3_9HEXA|nr:unnamed protein product [Allacma fusca]